MRGAQLRDMLRTLAIAAFAFVAAACTGSIGEDDGRPIDSEPGGGPGPQTTEAACTSTIEPGPSTTRRLTRIEYDNTIRDLLGVDPRLGAAFPPPDQTVLGFDNNVTGLTVTPVLAEQYMMAGEKLATLALPKVKAMASCSTTDAACADRVIEKLARRAFRRPPTAEQLASLKTAFAARKEPTFDSGIESVIQLVVQSPYFLYRVELDSIPTDDPTVLKLDHYEMASRLSYFLWNSMPDDELFAAAAGGKLGTKEELAEHARRMLKDPRAKAAVANFHREWFELDALEEVPKDPNVYPAFTEALRADLEGETSAFLDHVFWREGNLETLFTAPYTFVNSNLAKTYGLPAPTGSGFVQTETDPSKRIGILLQPSVLSLHAIAYESSPIYRGKFVREKILCHELPPPPEGLIVVPPEVDPTKSTRERYEDHFTNEACKGCHQMMDPIGFGFEHYDGMGRYREKDGTHAINSTGNLIGTDVDGPYDGAIELSKRLAKSATVSACVVTHWFRFAYGRGETDSDRCAVSTVKKQFAAAKYDMRELVVALTQTDAFRYRRVAP